MQKWTRVKTSSLYIAKQTLNIVLCLEMLAESVDGFWNGQYTFQIMSAPVMLGGMVCI